MSDFTRNFSTEPKKVSFDEFTGRIAENNDIPQEKAKTFVRNLFDHISDDLTREEKVNIYKFGTFKKKWVEEREGSDLQNKKITIPAHNKINFTPSKNLSDEVNKKYRHLQPNVLDEILTLTGITRISPELKHQLETNEEYKKDYSKAKKRALFTLIFLGILLLLFLAALILVPAYLVNENTEKNKVVSMIVEINQMFGLDKLSDSLKPIDKEKAAEFLLNSKSELIKNRKILAEHEVKSGDSIFSIAKKYWENEYLWPDLYIVNQEEGSSFTDPDLIHPGQKIVVYDSLGDPEKFNKKQRDEIVKAYIGVYRIYRALGEEDIAQGRTVKGERRIDDSRWTLYTAVRYDNELLEKYAQAIYPEDLELLHKYVEKFGFDGKKAE